MSAPHEKKCVRCKRTLAFKMFTRDKRSKDGFRRYCRKCARLFKRESAARPPRTMSVKAKNIARLIKHFHWVKRMSLRQVATKLGLKYAGLQWYLRRFKLPRRGRVESMNIVFNGHGPNWKGGRILVKGSKRGTQYIQMKDRSHPNADKRGYVYEHRAVMAAFVGRPLHPDEIVHHVNGDTQDNRIENLELRLRYGHEKPHGPLAACPHCGKPLLIREARH